MKPIGGYFEWEFPANRSDELHKGAVYLNSGRHALEYILRGLGNVRCLWIPYFTCDVVLQPLNKLGIAHKFYHINENLELASEINLADGEYLLYTNYYGIKDSYCTCVAEKYGERVIVDNAQALFCKVIPGIHQFYSPRKYMGMPDGGIAVTKIADYSETLSSDRSFDRCSHLLKRMEMIPSEGYADFKLNSKKIAEAPLSLMSPISKNIYGSVDLDFIKRRRRSNFERLHKALSSSNCLRIPAMDDFACPLVYPYWHENGKALKKKLIADNIFVATYWPNVFEWTSPNDLEYELAERVVCIPIDQRYGFDDMDRIIEEI